MCRHSASKQRIAEPAGVSPSFAGHNCADGAPDKKLKRASTQCSSAPKLCISRTIQDRYLQSRGMMPDGLLRDPEIDTAPDRSAQATMGDCDLCQLSST